MFFGEEAEPAAGEPGDSAFAIMEFSAFAIGVEVGEGEVDGRIEEGAGGCGSCPEPAAIEDGEGGDGCQTAVNEDAAAAEEGFFGGEHLVVGWSREADAEGAWRGVVKGGTDEVSGLGLDGPAAEGEYGIAGEGGPKITGGAHTHIDLPIGAHWDEPPGAIGNGLPCLGSGSESRGVWDMICCIGSRECWQDVGSE